MLFACEKCAYESIHLVGLRVHEKSLTPCNDVVARANGKMLRQPVCFRFWRKRVVSAIYQQNGHGQAVQKLPYIEIMNNGQHGEFVDSRPSRDFRKLFLDQVAGQSW